VETVVEMDNDVWQSS